MSYSTREGLGIEREIEREREREWIDDVFLPFRFSFSLFLPSLSPLFPLHIHTENGSFIFYPSPSSLVLHTSRLDCLFLSHLSASRFSSLTTPELSYLSPSLSLSLYLNTVNPSVYISRIQFVWRCLCRPPSVPLSVSPRAYAESSTAL